MNELYPPIDVAGSPAYIPIPSSIDGGSAVTAIIRNKAQGVIVIDGVELLVEDGFIVVPDSILSQLVSDVYHIECITASHDRIVARIFLNRE